MTDAIVIRDHDDFNVLSSGVLNEGFLLLRSRLVCANLVVPFKVRERIYST